MALEFTITPHELANFTVPYSICLLGEHQGLLGLGSIAVATNLSLLVEVDETSGDFALEVAPVPAEDDTEAAALVEAWRRVLQEAAAEGYCDLGGVSVAVELGEPAHVLPAATLLKSPAFSVAMALCLLGHGEKKSRTAAQHIAEQSAELLGRLTPSFRAHRGALLAQALVSTLGGAHFVGPPGDTVNVQLMLPPDALILVLSREMVTHAAPLPTEDTILQALRKAGPEAGRRVVSDQENLSRFFKLCAGALDETETGMLYGTLRVHEMIQSLLERLGDPQVDNDLLAEMCDEESSILGDYLAFPAGPYEQIASRASEIGALGGKYTYALGGCPALLIIAPGCRDELREALQREFTDADFLPLRVNAAGVSPAGQACL